MDSGPTSGVPTTTGVPASRRIDVQRPPPRRPSRPLCYVRRGGSPIESCTRAIHGLPLLTPGHDSNELLGGCLGKAAEYYDVDIYGFGFASTHYLCAAVHK